MSDETAQESAPELEIVDSTAEEMPPAPLQMPQQMLQAEPPPQPLKTLFDLLQEVIIPPNGTPVQLVSCGTCQQPLILSVGICGMGQYAGQWIAFPFCVNSMCATKRKVSFAPFGGGLPPFDPRSLRQ